MTEQKLAPGRQKPSKRRSIRLIGAALLLFVALVALFRHPLAGAIAQAICAGQSLTCKLTVSRADFGGVTFRGLTIAGPDAAHAAFSAERIAIDLSWGWLFSPRPARIGGDEIVMRIDLSGERPILGDLDATVRTFTQGPARPGPMPRLDFKTIRVIAETLGGPLEATGQVIAVEPEGLAIHVTAPASRLGLYGADVDLIGAELDVMINGDTISAKASLGLKTFKNTYSNISDVQLDISLEQSAGVLRGAGTASLGEVTLRDARLARAQAQASLESAALDPEAFDFNAWLADLRKLSLIASAGEGAIGEAAWSRSELKALVEPHATGGAGGDISFSADTVKLKQGSAGRLEAAGKVELPADGRPHAEGVARLRGGSLTAAQRNDLAAALARPLEAALPTFGAAIGRAADLAGQGFEVTAPWSIAMNEDGFDISALSGTGVKAASGLQLWVEAASATREAVTWSTADGGRWAAAGSVQLSGGGAPHLWLELARASGEGEAVSLAGAGKLAAWRVGEDVLSAEAAGLQFETRGDGGDGEGEFTLRLDGGLAGGVWKGAEATGQIKSEWSKGAFYAVAPRGLKIEWTEGRYGGAKFGAGVMHYAPKGRLAEAAGAAVIGQGTLARLDLPVSSDGFTAHASLGVTAINWRAEGGLRLGFDAAPSRLEFNWAGGKTPVVIADISGMLDLRHGWRVTGGFSGAEAKLAEAAFADLAGKFDLGGAHGALDGNLSGLAMRIFDPSPENARRYEEAKFEGSATLKDSIADYSGLFTLAKPGVQIARVGGLHDLRSGAGYLDVEPTPLIFTPRLFQPYHLSPLLRGPANVTGRADVSGRASWTQDTLKSSATLDLRRTGFAISSAGVFEGVSGRVQISDLLNMRSDPGQTITMDKVTLGLPIESGTVRFQLIGYDAIRLEGAHWPFVGGFIRVKPIDFRFGQVENRIIAQAVDWDLTTIVEQAKIPDIRISGTVNGDIPVSFSTGSARIDQAWLEASKDGGVIQYTGSTGDAAAQADPNAKMLFDALKDFRYQVMKLGVDGDIAGRIVLSMDLLGRNPTVLDGAQFKLGIGIDSALMELLNTTDWRSRIDKAVIDAAVGASN